MPLPPLPRWLALALVAAGAGLAGVLALPATTAEADRLVEGDPAEGETVGEEPEVVLLRFDRDLAVEAGTNSVAVIDAEGRRIDDGKAEISGYSARTMLVHLGETGTEGDLTVTWTVRFAESGDRVQGTFDFAVEPGADPEEEEPALATEEPRSGQTIVLWTVAVIGAVALFALLLFHLRVATGNAQSSLEEPGEHH